MGTFDRKLEQVLSETRRKSISKRLFHGTVALETLHNILSNGLKPGGARASYNLELRRGHGEGGVYLCSLSAALWYSWGKNGAPSVLEKHPQISKEQIYADERIFIIEAHVNFRSKELGLPEIASVYGEMPQEMS